MANGKAIIGSDIPGICDQLNEFPENLFQAGDIINLKNIIIDSKSGYSGAGRSVHKKHANKNLYESDFNSFLTLISEIVFEELKFKKLFTETYDLRPHHIEILEKFGFKEEKRIKSKVKIDGKYVDSVLHVYENSCKPK